MASSLFKFSFSKNMGTFRCVCFLASYFMAMIGNPLGVPPFAGAEKLLTEEMEEMAGIEENVSTNWAVVTDYQREDQCEPQPDHPSILSFSIVLQWPRDAINAGNGLTICYVGQLEGKEKNDSQSVVFGVQQRVKNVDNNSIAIMCESARAKLKESCEKVELDQEGKGPEECHAFTDRIWHGIRFVEDENGDLRMTMSTSQHSFHIPRSGFSDDDRLFYKLTTRRRYTSSFSRTIGQDESNPSRQNRIEEERNRVNVEGDRELQKEFWKKVGMGIRLKHYFGPWALALDLLPWSDGGKIDLYVIRSECSEMDATFLLPFESASYKLPKAMIKNVIQLDSVFRHLFASNRAKINGTIVFSGKVRDNAQNFSIELRNVKNNDDFRAIKMFVKFEEGIGKVTLQYRNKKNEPIDVPHSNMTNPPIVFHPGKLFRLKVISRLDFFEMSLNCGPFVKYEHGIKPPFTILLKMTMEGDLDLFKMETNNPSSTGSEWQINEIYEIPIAYTKGFFIKAKLNETWQKFSVELLRTDNEGFLESFAGFNVSSDKDTFDGYIKVSTDQNETSAKIGDTIKGGDEFEFYAILLEKSIEFTVNDRRIFSITKKKKKQLQIDAIQIDIDAKLVENGTIWATPYLFHTNIETFEFPIAYFLKGKVLQDAKEFTIDFIINPVNFNRNKIPINKCLEKKATCKLSLRIATSFVTNATTEGGAVPKDDGSSEMHTKYTRYTPFTKGKNFEVLVKFLNTLKYEVSVNGVQLGRTYELDTPTDLVPNYVQISGDILLLRKPTMLRKENINKHLG